MAVFGVMLAGGDGKRLGGVDKSRIRLNSRSLAHLVYNRLLGQTTAICIAGAYGQRNHSLPDRVARVSDFIVPPIGPLGGIEAGFNWAISKGASDPEDYLLIVPVDTPTFPKDFVQHTISAIKDADVVVARHGDQEYPTCSLWRIGAASNIVATRVNARNNSIRSYLDKLAVTYVDFAPFHVENPFKNVNKMSDLIEIESHLL